MPAPTISTSADDSSGPTGDSTPRSRKWTVWINGKIRGKVFGESLAQAMDNARQLFRVNAAATLQVRPKYPVSSDGLVDKDDPSLQPSSEHDAHILRVAMEVLGWKRQQVRLRASRITQLDLNHLLQGRADGAVKREIWRVLRSAGCEPEEISSLIHKTGQL